MKSPSEHSRSYPGSSDALPEWEDADVQTVYQMLCDDALNMPPNPEEHWEGWISRNIVRAMRARTGTHAQSSPRCDRCGSSGDTYVLCSGCGMPASPPYPVQSALTECASRCRYDGDLFHDQGNIERRDASWKAANMAEDALSALNRAKDFPQGVSFPSTEGK
jgi:hypothetical protein